MIAIDHLRYVRLGTRDLPAAVDFAERVLGLQLVDRNESAEALKRLQQVATANGNLFAELMETVKVCTLGQISHALYEVGGQYRRSM